MDILIVDNDVLENSELFNITLERNGLDSRITLDPVDGLVEITDNDGSYTHCYCCLTIVSHTTQRTHSFNSLIYSHFSL